MVSTRVCGTLSSGSNPDKDPRNNLVYYFPMEGAPKLKGQIDPQETRLERFKTVKDLLDEYVSTEDGMGHIAAMWGHVNSTYPEGSPQKQEAMKYALYHALIASGSPEFEPSIIKAFDTPTQDFAKILKDFTGLTV